MTHNNFLQSISNHYFTFRHLRDYSYNVFINVSHEGPTREKSGAYYFKQLSYDLRFSLLLIHAFCVTYCHLSTTLKCHYRFLSIFTVNLKIKNTNIKKSCIDGRTSLEEEISNDNYHSFDSDSKKTQILWLIKFTTDFTKWQGLITHLL